MFVLVTGAPASGKSTMATALAEELGLPLIAKDEIKDVLVATLGAADVQTSRQLGRAAVAVLKVVVEALPGAVVDSVWVDRSGAVEWASALHGPMVEVFCSCDPEVLRRRYAERAGTRGEGGFDLARTSDELWAAEYLRPLAGPWRVVTVDTTQDVDLASVLADLH